MSRTDAIGIFDSGVGGLTVAAEVFREMPNERIIYFGDTGHVPYGSRAVDELIKFADDIVSFLISQKVKIVIFACNTTSSVALDILKEQYDIPMIGVVRPGAEAAAKTSKNKKVGVIATEATINSGSYNKAINSFNQDIQVFGEPCPMFVPLVESGQFDTPSTYHFADAYLQPLISADIDTLVMGCTHYPYLSSVLQDILGANVELVDPAIHTVLKAKEMLKNLNLLNEENYTQEIDHQFYVSGDPDSFRQVGRRLVKDVIKSVQQIRLD